MFSHFPTFSFETFILNVMKSIPEPTNYKNKPLLTNLLGVKLVEDSRLSAVFPPQTEDLSLGAVGHVDEPLIPPPLHYHSIDTPQQDGFVTHLCKHGEQHSVLRVMVCVASS